MPEEHIADVAYLDSDFINQAPMGDLALEAEVPAVRLRRREVGREREAEDEPRVSRRCADEAHLRLGPEAPIARGYQSALMGGRSSCARPQSIVRESRS